MFLKSAFAALALATVAFTSPAYAEEAKIIRTISINGHGEIRAIPDLAQINIGVSSTAPTAREALEANTKNMTQLFDVLKKAGIENKDMTTSNFSVNPRMDFGRDGNQPGKVVGYDVNNMVTIVVRKIDDLGGLLDVAVSNGSNQINGITFSVSKPEAMLDDARKSAIADARHKAEIYAGAGAFALGDIMTVSEGVSMPQPVYYQMEKSARAASADVPIAQGEQVLSVDVSVTYAIK
jgi:uncharacterized protein YggE